MQYKSKMFLFIFLDIQDFLYSGSLLNFFIHFPLVTFLASFFLIFTNCLTAMRVSLALLCIFFRLHYFADLTLLFIGFLHVFFYNIDITRLSTPVINCYIVITSGQLIYRQPVLVIKVSIVSYLFQYFLLS